MNYTLICTYTDGEQHRYNSDDSKYIMKKISELLSAGINVNIKIKIKSKIK